MQETIIVSTSAQEDKISNIDPNSVIHIFSQNSSELPLSYVQPSDLQKLQSSKSCIDNSTIEELQSVDRSDFTNEFNPGGLGRLQGNKKLGGMLNTRCIKTICDYQNSMVVYEKSSGKIRAHKPQYLKQQCKKLCTNSNLLFAIFEVLVD